MKTHYLHRRSFPLNDSGPASVSEAGPLSRGQMISLASAVYTLCDMRETGEKPSRLQSTRSPQITNME